MDDFTSGFDDFNDLNSFDSPNGEWDVDDDALKRLEQATNMARDVNAELTNVQLAEKILEDSAPLAAQTIVRLATAGSNDQIKFRAASYLIDRVCGKSGDGPTKKSPWDDLFADVTVTANASKED